MTTEPPKGLRANLARMFNTITEAEFLECKAQHKYPKLIFALAYFHSVLLERRKFRTLGINIPYDFNDTDFKVSDDLLKTYLDEYEETPWDAIKYLISEANYGGRVTDEIDRRVLASYLNQFYCEDALSVPNYQKSVVSLKGLLSLSFAGVMLPTSFRRCRTTSSRTTARCRASRTTSRRCRYRTARRLSASTPTPTSAT
eukprot:1176285-Prorocentrum_minimum.AAC.2